MIELIELENGNLEIRVLNKKDFKDFLQKDLEERDALFELLEDSRYIGNGWESPTEIGLTEAPAISFGTQYDEETDEVIGYDKLWIFSDYQIKSYLKELKKYNFVIFNKV